MADIFDELIGEGAPAPELVAALRRQKRMGQIGALSGDKNIARLGGVEYDDAMRSATGIRDQRERAKAREDQQAFAKWQQQEANAQREEARRYQYAALKQARDLAQAQMQNQRDLVGLRNSGAGSAAAKARAGQMAKLESALRTSGIGNVWSAVEGARDVVDRYTDKDKAGNVTGYRGVPGVGGLANVRNLGIGTAANFGDSEGKQNQAKIAALQNLVLQARSGAAVTDPELQRMLAETGLTMFSSDEDFLRAFPELIKKAEQATQNVLAGYDPDVVQEYLQRGGLKGFKFGKGAGGDAAPTDPDAEIEALLSGMQ